MRKLKLVSNNPDFLDNRIPGDVIDILKDRAMTVIHGPDSTHKEFNVAVKVIRLFKKDDKGEPIFNETIESGRMFAAFKQVEERAQLSTNALVITESFHSDVWVDDELEKTIEMMEGENRMEKLIFFVNNRLFGKRGENEKEFNSFLSCLLIQITDEFIQEGYTPDLANIVGFDGSPYLGLAFNKTVNEVRRTFVICATLNHPTAGSI